MQISWDDVNRTEKRGVYFVPRLGIDVFILEEAIKRWKADPKGLHTVTSISTGLGNLYGLGKFHPSE